MNTENLSTLKIHKLTQAQYDRELEAGRIDENALYLTPDNVVSALSTEMSSKLNRSTAVNAADTNYTTLMARGTSLNSVETTPTVNGAIAWTYE